MSQESYTQSVAPINPLPQQIQVPDLQPFGTPGSKLLEIERSSASLTSQGGYTLTAVAIVEASFSSHDMAVFIRGQDLLDRQARLLEVITKEPAFDKSRIPYQGRGDKFSHGLAKEKRFVQLAQEHGWSGAFSLCS